MNETSLQVASDEGITIISLGTEYATLEGSLVKELEAKLLAVIQQEQCTHLILEMQHTKFFGSSFIESLVQLWNQMKARKAGTFQLCSLQPYCKEVLEVTHLDKIWEIYDTPDQALQHCKSSMT